MQIGMLWFDNNKEADLFTKISRAVQYYQEKYGKTPNICFIHPTMLPDDHHESKPLIMKTPTIIEIRASPLVLPNHFWIGINSQTLLAGQNGRFLADHPKSRDLSPTLNQAGPS